MGHLSLFDPITMAALTGVWGQIEVVGPIVMKSIGAATADPDFGS